MEKFYLVVVVFVVPRGCAGWVGVVGDQLSGLAGCQPDQMDQVCPSAGGVGVVEDHFLGETVESCPGEVGVQVDGPILADDLDGLDHVEVED